MMSTFQTTDSVWRKHNGEEIVATSPMPEDAYDREEVGPMVYATLSSGVTVEAFADEIVTAPS